MLKTLFITSLIFFASAASAQELLGAESSWKIYAVTQDGRKMCYLAGSPTKSDGTFKRRGDVYFLVTQKNKDQMEASASSGFIYKESTDVHITLSDKKKFRLFTQEKLGWARDSKTDDAIIEAMGKATSMTVRGTSQKNTYAEDTYSLRGFNNALKKLKASCP